eukprot:1524961-Pyramimonas_sp.AAC.1
MANDCMAHRDAGKLGLSRPPPSRGAEGVLGRGPPLPSPLHVHVFHFVRLCFALLHPCIGYELLALRPTDRPTDRGGGGGGGAGGGRGRRGGAGGGGGRGEGG